MSNIDPSYRKIWGQLLLYTSCCRFLYRVYHTPSRRCSTWERGTWYGYHCSFTGTKRPSQRGIKAGMSPSPLHLQSIFWKLYDGWTYTATLWKRTLWRISPSNRFRLKSKATPPKLRNNLERSFEISCAKIMTVIHVLQKLLAFIWRRFWKCESLLCIKQQWVSVLQNGQCGS